MAAGTVTLLHPRGPGARRNVRSVDVARLGAPFNRHAALVTGSLGLVLLDALSGEVLVRLPPEGATSCALSRGPGPVAASGFDSGRIALWDLASERVLAELGELNRPVVSLAFSPEGGLLLSGSLDGTVRLWDVATREELASEVHGGKVAFAPTGKLVASGGWGAEVQVCALKGLRPEKGLRPVKGLLSVKAWNHGAPVESLCFLPDGEHVVTGAAIGTVYVWRASDGREVRRFELGAKAFAVAAHGGRVVAGGDNRVRRWDLETGRLVAEAPGLPQPGTVQAVAAFDEGGREHALVGTDLHGLWLWTVGP